MPDVPSPDTLPDLSSYFRDILPRLAPNVRAMLEKQRPFEFRPTLPPAILQAGTAPSHRSIWFRAVAPLPDDDALHRCLLAYVSDFHLLDTALMPHGLSIGDRGLVMASIDHAMWFHHSMRVDDWLLYCTDTPSASGARGFARGSIFARDGRLVASTAQEGLMRRVTP
jgi:acyl-CoA thioesterase-2